MTTPETRIEFAQPILERHESGASEADIRSAVRDFLIGTGLAPESEIQQEEAPAPGESGRVDLRTRDVIIEFKRSIGNGIDPHAEYVKQLDDYLIAAASGGQTQRFGILTDGKYWILRWPGMGAVSTSAPNAFTLANEELGTRLFDWLSDQSQALEPRGLVPTETEVRQRLGAGPRFELHLDGLRRLYEARRDAATVQVKRELWRRLLAAALGQVVEEAPDLDELFLRHTYLSAVVGLALQSAFGIDITRFADSDPEGLLGGRYFLDETGLSGVVESDFFSWPVESELAEAGGATWLQGLASRVSWFNWTHAESDMARVLYEAVIPAADRKRLGEYYTPDWLARAIVDEVVTDPLNQRVLDPACGSGSFIYAAVRKYLEAAREAGMPPGPRLDGLLNRVIGIDVHPVAVHLARATWTFAAREALESARDANSEGPVPVPIYLGDSLQLRTETESGELFKHTTVTIEVQSDDEDITLEFPRALVEQADWFDSLMDQLARAIESGEEPSWVLDDQGIDGADRTMLDKTAETLQRLHAENRDHIWAYYVRNLVRPVALRNSPVDVIVGNPPWLTYNRSEAVVREELERQSKDRYGIWQGGVYATHQDVAGFFYARCVDLYLRDGGVAGMVLPHSALQTGQYQKWRLGDWGQLSVDLQHATPLDLERIEPNTFFPVPACVAFLKRHRDFPKRLGKTASRWRGPEGGQYTYESVPLTDTGGSEYASPYGERARNGATIFPRILFFVEEQESTAAIQAVKLTTVSPRRSAQEKQPWKSLHPQELIAQSVESAHVFDVHLGETLAPYVLLDPLKAVLPLSKETGELVKRDEGGWYGLDPRAMGERMRRRWRTINELWEEHKSPNNSLSLIERLDYFGNLSSQRSAPLVYSKSTRSLLEDAYHIRVLYAGSGRPTAAILTDDLAVVDYKLFYIDASSIDEARYLSTIVNSRALEDVAIPLMTKGQFGARDLQKHIWRLPIPEFDGSDELHLAIAEAGAEAAVGARALWDEVRAERAASGKSTSVTVARREIRQWLSQSNEGQRVEELVGRLLG